LERFEELDPRAAEVVQLKFFVGLNHEEIAEALEVSRATVVRDWASARAWLWREMQHPPPSHPDDTG
jgi:RNA polymerase sigma factor (sigma-70 family)